MPLKTTLERLAAMPNSPAKDPLSTATLGVGIVTQGHLHQCTHSSRINGSTSRNHRPITSKLTWRITAPRWPRWTHSEVSPEHTVKTQRVELISEIFGYLVAVRLRHMGRCVSEQHEATGRVECAPVGSTAHSLTHSLTHSLNQSIMHARTYARTHSRR